MTNLNNLKLSDILPNSIKTDEILAICSALDNELQDITNAINEIMIIPYIDKQPEEIVDLLAWQFHVDFYEPLGLDLEKKRTLVKNSLLWHKYKGTKYVLIEIIKILFFDNFDLEEWFEYGGQPYFFRIIARDVLQDLESYMDLIRAIDELKNGRSWLEYIRFELNAKSNQRYAVGIMQQTYLTIPTASIRDY